MSDVDRIDENVQDVLKREARRLDGTLNLCAVLLLGIAILQALTLLAALGVL